MDASTPNKDVNKKSSNCDGFLKLYGLKKSPEKCSNKFEEQLKNHLEEIRNKRPTKSECQLTKGSQKINNSQKNTRSNQRTKKIVQIPEPNKLVTSEPKKVIQEPTRNNKLTFAKHLLVTFCDHNIQRSHYRKRK